MNFPDRLHTAEAALHTGSTAEIIALHYDGFISAEEMLETAFRICQSDPSLRAQLVQQFLAHDDMHISTFVGSTLEELTAEGKSTNDFGASVAAHHKRDANLPVDMPIEACLKCNSADRVRQKLHTADLVFPKVNWSFLNLPYQVLDESAFRSSPFVIGDHFVSALFCDRCGLAFIPHARLAELGIGPIPCEK